MLPWTLTVLITSRTQITRESRWVVWKIFHNVDILYAYLTAQLLRRTYLASLLHLFTRQSRFEPRTFPIRHFLIHRWSTLPLCQPDRYHRLSRSEIGSACTTDGSMKCKLNIRTNGTDIAGIALSVQQRARGWPAGVRFLAGVSDFSVILGVQPGSRSQLASCTIQFILFQKCIFGDTASGYRTSQ
jgi:hypothetical protein